MSASESILKILGNPKESAQPLRPMCYVISTPVDDGVLMFHLLTRELLLLSHEEFKRIEALPELRQRWFVVPQSLPDKTYADRVKFVLKAMQKKPTHITHYTIFTTTDCNARCFYCYEMGRSRIPMSEETAHKAASYIAKHCGGETVTLQWFGGEPLFNKTVIDIICRDLNELGIEYRSRMISNAYLFDDETVKQAVALWRLKNVQITLDGTEDVYNRSKAFIYRDGKSPYAVVMDNIGRLLDAGIKVVVRMNIDKHNAENLLLLADELHERFGARKGLSAYSHVLFEYSGNKERVRAAEERRQLYQKQQALTERLNAYGFLPEMGISKSLPITHCMADGGNSLTVLPGGELGLCEHYSEDHFVGTLDSGTLDADTQKLFSETRQAIADCAACFYYPKCIRLKMCEETKECFPEQREDYLLSAKTAMRTVYSAWLKQEELEETEQSEIC